MSVGRSVQCAAERPNMSTVLERLETRMQAFSRRHNKTGIVSSCVAEPNVHSGTR